MDRRVLNELLSTIVRGDSLVIYDLSRLNRNITDFLTLIGGSPMYFFFNMGHSYSYYM